MAVLEHDPHSVLLALLDHALRMGPLALAERDRLDAPALGLGKLEKGEHRVDARREDEDERRGARRVFEGALEVEGRRLDVLLAEVVRDELRDGRHELVHPDGAQHEHELELRVALRPLRQLVEDEVRLGRVEKGLPCAHIRGELTRKPLGEGELAEAVDVLPHLLGDPRIGRLLTDARRVEQDATREQVAPLGVVELVVAHQQRDAEQQRED